MPIFGFLGFSLLVGNVVPQEVPIPSVKSGSIHRVAEFKSKFVVPRNVDIWLPDGYSNATRYSVLYMSDGQGLFDPSHTWNHQAWGVDQIATKLIRDGDVPPFVVVGAYNSKNRVAEYFPQNSLDFLSPGFRQQVLEHNLGVKPEANQYLKFLTQELKPYIDSHYSTKSDVVHTFVAGSSMGGLIAWYSMCEYPNTFGGAACLSTHWPGAHIEGEFGKELRVGGAIMLYLAAKLPDPKTHKLYMDHGDQTLDSLYGAWQEQVDRIAKFKGWDANHTLSLVFPGEDHTDQYWGGRFPRALKFLMGKQLR